MVDPLGLLDSEDIAAVRRGDLTAWIRRHQPEYYVTTIGSWDQQVLASPCFAATFEREHEIAPLTIFRRTGRWPTSGCDR